MDKYKKFILRIMLVSIAFVGLYGAMAYIRDPLMLLHKPYFKNNGYDKDLRISNASVMHNVDFDSVIIGTSMLMNTSPNLASQILNGKFINTTAESLGFSEVETFLKYAFRHQSNIKQIIISFDAITNSTSRIPYMSLYDESVLNDLFVYFQPRFFKCIVGFSNVCYKKKDLDTRTFWLDASKRKALGGFESWLQTARNYREASFILDQLEVKEFLPVHNEKTIADFESTKESLGSILRLIKTSPNIQFEIIVPPYSKYHYYAKNGQERFVVIRDSVKYFLSEVQNCPNVRVYGFDNLDYTKDIANYTDPIHYEVSMNNLFLEAIKAQTHLLTLENFESYFDQLKKDIKAFDMKPYIEVIKQHYGLE